MQRFILRQNILHFQRALDVETNEASRQTLHALMAAARRKLAFLEASAKGAELGRPFVPFGSGAPLRGDRHFEQLHRMLTAQHGPCMVLDPGPGLCILGINNAYAAATMTVPADVHGRSLFDVFPDNPADPLADGVANLYGSLTIAARQAKPHAMTIQRYDIRDRHGHFIERHWQPVNTPLFDDDGRLIALMHRVDDVTATVTMATNAARVVLA